MFCFLFLRNLFELLARVCGGLIGRRPAGCVGVIDTNMRKDICFSVVIPRTGHNFAAWSIFNFCALRSGLFFSIPHKGHWWDLHMRDPIRRAAPPAPSDRTHLFLWFRTRAIQGRFVSSARIPLQRTLKSLWTPITGTTRASAAAVFSPYNNYVPDSLLDRSEPSGLPLHRGLVMKFPWPGSVGW